jgi:hypothetical protein
VEGDDDLMGDLAAGFNTLAASAISVGSMAALESDVLAVTQTSTLFSSAWPTAALAMFYPTLIEQPLVVTQMTHVNGGTLAGNVDVGVYDRFGNLLVSKGGVAQAGASTIQAHDLTDTLLAPGFYYRAIVFSLATATVERASPAALLLRAVGVKEMASAYPLPAVATLSWTVTACVAGVSLNFLTTV